MDGADNWHGAFRIELRAEAISLAWRGWPVLPGALPTTSPATSPAVQGGEDIERLVPVHADWADRIGTPPAQVAGWWTGLPYGLLVATGVVLDAVEVDAQLGRRVATLLRSIGAVTPIAATPTGRWLFLTTMTEHPHPGLHEVPDVRVHGSGSWIPLPPSPYGEGIVHWRVKPEICGWQLPEASLVQGAIAAAARGRGQHELVGTGAAMAALDRLSA